MGIARSRIAGFGALILSAALLAGCEGDTGDPGPAGPPGQPGTPGTPGTGGTGSGLPISSVQDVDRINAEITSVEVPAGGGAPVVEFRLANQLGQGLAGAQPADVRFVIAQLRPGVNGGSSDWQSYIARRENGQLQATAEAASSGAAGRLVDNGDGTYQYTFANALTGYTDAPAFDAALTHRVTLELRNNAPTINPSYDFVPSGGQVATRRAIVDNDTCNACHDILAFHGGARSDTENCVTCHNPSTIDGSAGTNGASADMKVMIHKIHGAAALTNAYAITGYGNTTYQFSDGSAGSNDVHYPQDVRNCTTCHDESDEDTPEASNWRTVANRAACGSCHDDRMASPNNPGAGVMNHPGGLTLSDDSQCVQCHGPTATVNGGAVQIANAHQIPLDVQSAKFAYEVVSVTDQGGAALESGEQPRVTIRVVDPTNNNAPWDIQAANGPFRQSNAALRVDLAWTGQEFSNIGSASNSAPAGGSLPAGNAPFQPTQVTFASGVNAVAGVANNGNGTFTANAFQADGVTPFLLPVKSGLFPAGADAALESGGLVAILEGRPRVDTNGDGTIDASAQVAGRGGVFGWDGDASVRPDIVDINRCNECHEVLSLHGGNRTDNTQLCATCHNPNATDIRQRTVTGTAPYLANSNCRTLAGGDIDVSIDFRYMVHAIHAAAPRAERGAPPYKVCGNNASAYVFYHQDVITATQSANETDPAEYSSFPANNQVNVEYPGQLNNCESCHVKPTATNPSYYGREPSKMLAVTMRAGTDRVSLSDDTAHSPTVAACVACHTTTTAISHMTQNGGVYNGPKLATGQVTNQAETCALCHGPGRTADIREVHNIDFYPLNNP